MGSIQPGAKCSRSNLFYHKSLMENLQTIERNPFMTKSGVDVMKQILLQDLLSFMLNPA